MLSEKPRLCLDGKPSRREETPCVGAAAAGAAQPARAPLGPRRLSGGKAPWNLLCRYLAELPAWTSFLRSHLRPS